MVPVNLKELIGKLNATARRSLEGAAGLCLSRTNYNVEIEHWLAKMLEADNSDFAAILKYFGVDEARLNADLTRVIDGFKTGNSRPPALSPNLVDLVRASWLVASVEFGESAAGSGHLLYALVGDDGLARVALGASREL
jgi:type VI secretion system protein VasG